MANLSRDCKPSEGLLSSSYYQGISSEPLLDSTIGEVLQKAAGSHPDRELFRVPEYKQTITPLALLKKANAVSKSLLSLGVKKGDIVAVLGVNTVDYFALIHGSFAIGAILITPFLPKPRNISLLGVLNTAEPRVIVSGYRETDDAIKAVDDLIDHNCQHKNSSTAENFLPEFIIGYWSEPSHKRKYPLSYEQFLQKGQSVGEETLSRAKASVWVDDIAWIMASSGTTGRIKLISQSHRSLVNFAKFITIRRNPFGKAHVEAYLNPLVDDVSHVMKGLSPLCCSENTVGVLLPSAVDLDEGSSAEALMKCIETERITSLSVYPFWIIGILNHPNMKKYDLSSLTSGVLMSQDVSAKIKEKVLDTWPESLIVYGASEFFLGCATSPAKTTKEEFSRTVGFPFPHCEMKIVGSRDEIVPVNTVGEICLRGWPVFSGYYRNGDSGENPIDSQNWYRTCDLGRMDTSGYVTFIGRKADCIRFKRWCDIVYPGYIETEARKHPKVKDAVAVGIPNDVTGDDICLCVILEENEELSKTDLEEYISQRMFDRDMPDYYIFFERFPRVGSRNKVSRNMLRDIVRKKLSE